MGLRVSAPDVRDMREAHGGVAMEGGVAQAALFADAFASIVEPGCHA
jgi:hypothetical protein